jgi:hypothetical protein
VVDGALVYGSWRIGVWLVEDGCVVGGGWVGGWWRIGVWLMEDGCVCE